MFRDTPIIDVDARQIEHPLVFPEFVAAEWRDRLRLAMDGRAWEIDDRDGATPAWRRVGNGGAAFLQFPTALGAAFQSLRAADLAREHIDAQLLFPSLGFHFPGLRRADVALGLCRAYNDYLRAECAGSRGRCVPVGVIPLHDVAAAVEELRRCVVDLDMPAVLLPHVAPFGTLAHHDLAPLYETAEYLDAALIVHAAAVPTASMRAAGGPLERLDAAMMHRAELQWTLAHLLAGGVLERFSKLRFGFFGGGCGWVPDFVFALGQCWPATDGPEPPALFAAGRFLWESLRAGGATGIVGRQRQLRELRTRVTQRAAGAAGAEGAAGLAPVPRERNPEEYFARNQLFFSVGSGDPAPAHLRRAFGPVGERLGCWTSGYGDPARAMHFDGSIERMTTDPEIGLDYVERLLSRNTLRLFGPRLQRRLDRLSIAAAGTRSNPGA